MKNDKHLSAEQYRMDHPGGEDLGKLHRYWQHNLRYLAILLSIWFLGSYGCGILFYKQLNAISVGGFQLGFWFAQQGSIYLFVMLIFVYVRLMNSLDKRFNVQEN